MPAFITIEGMDGCGKGTQIEMLKKRWPDFVYAADPGSTSVGEDIRSILLSENMSATTEALLYAAARAEMVENIIVPAMDAGKNVICDRYVDSNFAYQGFGRHLGFTTIYNMHMAGCGLMPDLTIFLDIPPEIALKRIPGEGDRIEREPEAFHKEVYEGYLWIAKTMSGRIVKVDATGNPEQVFSKVQKIISEAVERGRNYDRHVF